jgi:DNA repair protein RadC
MEPAYTLLPATSTTHLSDVELLALTLGHLSMRRAARLLARFHDLDGIARAPLHDFELERMTARRALQLQAAFELGRRSLARPLKRGAPMTTSHAIVELLGPRLVALEQEEMHILGLDNQHRLVIHFVAARGTVNQVYVNARDVYRQPVRENCSCIVAVHNHPSGDPEPSSDDRRLTEDLEQAGKIMNVALLDHVIVARRGHFSFRSVGALESQEFGH